MKLGGAKCFLKSLAPAQRSVKLVGAEQVLVVEDDVVNPDNLVFTELEIVQARPRLVHIHAQSEMRIVVEIGAGADNPVHEAGFDKRDQATRSQTRRRQR